MTSNDSAFYDGDPGDEQPEISNNQVQSVGETLPNEVPRQTQIAQPQVKNQINMTDEEKEEFIERLTSALAESGSLGLNFFKFKRLYPKALAAFEQYCSIKVPAGVVDEDTLVGILLYSARNIIYDFFDSKEIYINILGSDNSWVWNTEYFKSTNNFKSRVYAETDAFDVVFSNFEKSL